MTENMPAEATYRAIFDSANDAIFVHDLDTGQILDANNRATEMYGCTLEQVREVSVEAISAGVPPFTQTEAREWLRRACTSPQVFEWWAKDFAGRLFWVEVNIKRVTLAGVDRLLAIARDITERKRADEDKRRLAAVEAEQQQVRAVLESIRDAFISLDAEWRCVYVNREAERLLKRSREDLLGKILWEVYPHLVGSVFDRESHRAMAEQTTLTIESFWTTLGIWTSVRAYPSPRGLSIYFQDITERKLGEEARARLIAILEQTSDFVATAAASGRVVYFNRAARRMLGIADDEDISTVRIPDTHPEWANAIVLTEGIPTAAREGVWSGETSLLARDGREIPISQVIIAHKTPSGEREYVSTIGRDITERKRIEKFREEYIQAVSHDLRGPLSAIGMQVQILERAVDEAGPRSEARRKSVMAIRRGVERMTGMIQELVESARLETGQLQLQRRALDLRPFVADLLEGGGAIRRAERIRAEIPSGLPRVHADPDRLARVFMNLLGNALKFSPDESEVVVTARLDGDVIRVAIADQGEGIAPVDLPHLFERFYRARKARATEGLGLGLYISKLIVEAHGGRIWADSAAGRGTTFCFTLPTA